MTKEKILEKYDSNPEQPNFYYEQYVLEAMEKFAIAFGSFICEYGYEGIGINLFKNTNGEILDTKEVYELFTLSNM